ncbi:MAG: phosphate ABC transporter substrate-binding protein [Desulfovibrio sp.]|nr:phosphate ABC transporter substrate-binding protein [Desulfovibrio sp.]
MSFDFTSRIIRHSGKLFASAVAVLCLSAPALAAQQVTINGSTTVLPVVQKAGEAFMASHPGTEISISGGGSGNGIKALIEKQCDVAMSSRDIKDKEKTAAAKNGVNPTRTAIAIDAIVPVVNPGNKVGALTIEQLRDIFSGKITNWKDLGGDDAQIVAISRDTSSGTFESWEELVMNKERVTPKALMQASNGAVVQAVSKNKNAIGYVGLGYVDKSTKGLKVNNITPNAETAISKQWPIARELYIFTNGAPQGTVKEFVEYLLAPDKGQKNVLEVGYVPLAK